MFIIFQEPFLHHACIYFIIKKWNFVFTEHFQNPKFYIAILQYALIKWAFWIMKDYNLCLEHTSSIAAMVWPQHLQPLLFHFSYTHTLLPPLSLSVYFPNEWLEWSCSNKSQIKLLLCPEPSNDILCPSGPQIPLRSGSMLSLMVSRFHALPHLYTL